jgi:actin-like ATPase involved in cell morphogenesis
VVDGARLGIDFGTSTTVAVLAWPDRGVRPLLFDGSPLLPSAVCADASGRLLVGQDALHAALTHPASFEPNPKRRIDEGALLLGSVEVSVEEAIAAVLRRVAGEATRIADGPVGEVVVTCPAGWRSNRRATLLSAASTALPGARLVPEPVAAANYFVEVAGSRVPEGRYALVYDFGAGTFDVSVVRRGAEGFEVLVAEGLADTGGLDVDAAIVTYLESIFAPRDGALWARLARPETAVDRRASRLLWQGARAGKETLSRTTTTMLHVPLFDAEVPLGREQLEELARPILERTVEASRAALQSAEVPVGEVAGLFLVGGSSRMPLVGTVLHTAFGIAPTVIDQPELAVAEGSLCTGQTPATPDRTPDGWPVSAPLPMPAGPAPLTPPAPPTPEPAPPARRFGRWLVVAAAGLVLAVLIATGVALAGRQPAHGDPLAGGASHSPSRSPSGSPSPSLAANLDPCLIGTWRGTHDEKRNTINGKPVLFTGNGGGVVTYRPDGTTTVDFATMDPIRAVVDGDTWTETDQGSATMRYHTVDGVEYDSEIHIQGTWTLRRNGKVNNTGNLTISTTAVPYECSGDTLRSYTSFSTSVSTRVH